MFFVVVTGGDVDRRYYNELCAVEIFAGDRGEGGGGADVALQSLQSPSG